jgi:ribosomal protein S18 acetylase RimI-like enzyme
MITVEKAREQDIHAIHEIVQAAFAREAVRVNNWKIAPLAETEENLRPLIGKITILVAKEDGAIVGTGRATPDGDTVRIGRLAVRPNCQRRGIATTIVRALEAGHPSAARFEIFTSETSLDNIALYNKLGYAIYDRRKGPDGTALVFMEKRHPAK